MVVEIAVRVTDTPAVLYVLHPSNSEEYEKLY
jgi:hypothetical protein